MINFSDHAKKRMKERNITTNEVLDILHNGYVDCNRTGIHRSDRLYLSNGVNTIISNNERNRVITVMDGAGPLFDIYSKQEKNKREGKWK